MVDNHKAEVYQTDEIIKKLVDCGYSYSLAVATQSEIDNGAACGQLSIISE